jgi:hypothetical protein
MLQPINKNTVKKMIRDGKRFKGWIAPSLVNPYHINNGWHIGAYVEYGSIDEMEKSLLSFAYYNCNSELGYRVKFWID